MFLLQVNYLRACRSPVASLAEERDASCVSPSRVCSDTQGNVQTQRPDIHENYCLLGCDAMKLFKPQYHVQSV
jgi:hypothetical protein